MLFERTIAGTRAALAQMRRRGARIGFVPTMGALHAGHLSLVERSRRDGCRTVVSIFVNPTQFGPNEDFARYPRDEPRDLELCRRAGVELVFAPTVDEMYPDRTPLDPDCLTSIRVARLSETLCGPHRPGHFEGVATVVAKLLNVVHPDRAYFGEKDAQQLAVVRRMVRDLNVPVEIVGCPTVREADGLAMSSRNALLDPRGRAQAACLFAALREVERLVRRGERDAHALRGAMRAVIEASGPACIDYAEVVDPESMQPLERIGGAALAALAVRIGGTRLIDNLRIDAASVDPPKACD